MTESLDEKAADFRNRIAAVAGGIDSTSVSSNKNRPLESLVAQEFGWRSVAVKWVPKVGRIGNALGELVSVRASHGVVMTKDDLRDNLVEKLKARLAASGYRAVVLVDSAGPEFVITDVVRLEDEPIPPLLTASFPSVEDHVVPPLSSAYESSGPVEAAVKEPHPEYTVGDCAAETGVLEADLRKWLDRLRRKKHLVFQGPPGTGKTFMAQRLTRALLSRTSGATETVQFHPSYAYEDFVQGIRPVLAGGGLAYQLRPGRFLDFCAAAREVPSEPFVLIIDEMNRGNLSRIFGELFFLLEYRNKSVPLAQGGPSFAVPENVYLIGTMNTADRSIALVDHALRRRFSFVFLSPDYQLLRRKLTGAGLPADSLVDVLERVNATIEDRNYHVGTSYFLSSLQTLGNDLPDIWEGEVEPYLDEFFFDQPERVNPFRWAALSEGGLSEWTIGTSRTTVTAAARPPEDETPES